MNNQLLDMNRLNELFKEDGQFCYLNAVSLYADVARHIINATGAGRWRDSLDVLDTVELLQGIQALDSDATFNRYELSIDNPRVQVGYVYINYRGRIVYTEELSNAALEYHHNKEAVALSITADGTSLWCELVA